MSPFIFRAQWGRIAKPEPYGPDQTAGIGKSWTVVVTRLGSRNEPNYQSPDSSVTQIKLGGPIWGRAWSSRRSPKEMCPYPIRDKAM